MERCRHLVQDQRARARRHAYLRDATAGVHAEVERVVDAAGFFADVARYGEYLRRMRTFHRQFEDVHLVASPAARAHWRAGEHVAWLGEDLAALGITVQAADPPFRRARVSDRTAALGALYVVVGSALGARLLVGHARALVPAGRGDGYLSRLATTTDWPAFLELLEREEISSEERLGDGAIGAFESILDVLGDRPPA